MEFVNRLFMMVLTVVLVGTMSINGANERKCSIKQIVGSVKVRRGSSTTWRDARPKMPLKESDALRTFMESEAEFETSEGTVVTIGENTTIELSQFYGDTEKQATTVKILNGAVLANVKKLVSTKSSFDFETPTATAAIRGTVVGFEVNKEMTRVKVYEGKVWVVPQGANKGVEIQPNQMGVVNKGVDEVAVEKIDEKTPVALSVAQPDSAEGNQKDVDSSSVVDSSRVVDSTQTVDTTGQSLNKSNPVAPLTLSLNAPAEGAVYPPQSQIPVIGSVTPNDATVLINGKGVSVTSSGNFKTVLLAGEKNRDMEINVMAEKGGAAKNITRRVSVKASKLNLVISSPFDGQEFRKALIPVNGTVTPGSEVSVQSIKVPVNASGVFSGQIPIANESGAHTLEFEASLDGATQKITRQINYKPEYRFIMTTPAERQTINRTMFAVSGEVLPVNAEVTVMGQRLSVSANGRFNGFLTIPDEEGEVILDFEISAPGVSRSEQRKISYVRPPDTFRPQLSASVTKSCWSITVFDRTVDEEITLWSDIDGVKESRSMRPNESTCLPFNEGVHTYTVYAEDKSGNVSSNEILRNYSYLSGSLWMIKMRKPAGNMVLNLPPASPSGEQAIYTIELTIDNLPDDNMSLIREVVITNKTNGEKVFVRNFTDNFISSDIELARNRDNVIQIDAKDINNVTKNQIVRMQVR